MKTYFRGLTEATITLNTLDIIIHGQEDAGVDVDTESQEKELQELVTAGIIEITGSEVIGDSISDSPPVVPVETEAETTLDVLNKAMAAYQAAKNALVQAEAVVAIAEAEHNRASGDAKAAVEAEAQALAEAEVEANIKVEAEAAAEAEAEAQALAEAKEAEEAETNTSKPKPIKRGRGRPKGSKNKQTKKEPTGGEPEESHEEESSRVIVATPNGPVEGQMKKSAIPDAPESEQTRASIEAMEKLEAEEAEEAEEDEAFIDESELDPSERMGNEAVISTGKEAVKVELTNSILPEAEVIKERDPFIENKDLEAVAAAEKADAEAEAAFVSEPEPEPTPEPKPVTSASDELMDDILDTSGGGGEDILEL